MAQRALRSREQIGGQRSLDNAQDGTDSSLGRLTLSEKGTGSAPSQVDINAGDPFVVTFDAVGPVRHKVGTLDADSNVEFVSGANITLTGTRRDITINDVIAVEGARVPAAQEGGSLRVVFILLQQAGPPPRLGGNRDVLVQELGGEISTIGPDQRMELQVYAKLLEYFQILEWFKD